MEESGPLTADLDDQMESVENISRQLNDQLKMNVSYSECKLYIFISATLCCCGAATRRKDANLERNQVRD